MPLVPVLSLSSCKYNVSKVGGESAGFSRRAYGPPESIYVQEMEYSKDETRLSQPVSTNRIRTIKPWHRRSTKSRHQFWGKENADTIFDQEQRRQGNPAVVVMAIARLRLQTVEPIQAHVEWSESGSASLSMLVVNYHDDTMTNVDHWTRVHE